MLYSIITFKHLHVCHTATKYRILIELSVLHISMYQRKNTNIRSKNYFFLKRPIATPDNGCIEPNISILYCVDALLHLMQIYKYIDAIIAVTILWIKCIQTNKHFCDIARIEKKLTPDLCKLCFLFLNFVNRKLFYLCFVNKLISVLVFGN